jgi:hypothetical protein
MKRKKTYDAGNGRRKQVADLNISKIIRQFHAIEEVDEQHSFVERKINELILADSATDKLSLLSRIRIAYLVRFRHADLILNGLLKMACDDLEALSGITDIEKTFPQKLCKTSL